MTRIYLVRHGETLENRTRHFQHHDTPLSVHGREQAESTAGQLAKLPIKAVITSNLKRSEETAEVIAGGLNVLIESLSLFAEVKRPSEIVGKSYFHPFSLWVLGLTMLQKVQLLLLRQLLIFS